MPRLAACLLVLTAAVLAGGCKPAGEVKEATGGKKTHSRDELKKLLPIGSTMEDVKAKLGPPDTASDPNDKTVITPRWGYRGISIGPVTEKPEHVLLSFANGKLELIEFDPH